MRSKAWDTLEKDGCIAIWGPLSKQKHLKRNQLIANCKKIDIASWKEEIDMYNDIIEAIQKGLNNPQQKKRRKRNLHRWYSFKRHLSRRHQCGSSQRRLPPIFPSILYRTQNAKKTNWTHRKTVDSFWTTSMPSIKSSLTGQNLLPSCPTLKNPGSTSQTILPTALLSLSNVHVNLRMQLSSLTNYQKLNTRTKFQSLKIGLDLSTMFLPYQNSTSCFQCQNLKWCRF